MPANSNSWSEALFANLLRSIRVQSSVHFRPIFGAPWGFSLDGERAAFHIVVRGKCWLKVATGKPVRLSAGDFVVIPSGRAHAVWEGSPLRLARLPSFFELLKRCRPDVKGELRVGGDGALTELMCGGMKFENAKSDPLLAVLPPFIHVKANGRSAPPWLRATLSHLQDELDSKRPGERVVVTRLADILFIQAVRAFFGANPDASASGWLTAVRDRQIGPALAILHNEPHRPWTVASLARRVALSRSAFASRFASLVGEPPLHYLTRLRVSVACERLREGDERMNAIASSVGYDSTSALHKAFKRILGVTPGGYRRTQRLDQGGSW